VKNGYFDLFRFFVIELGFKRYLRRSEIFDVAKKLSKYYTEQEMNWFLDFETKFWITTTGSGFDALSYCSVETVKKWFESVSPHEISSFARSASSKGRIDLLEMIFSADVPGFDFKDAIHWCGRGIFWNSRGPLLLLQKRNFPYLSNKIY
jgi:hypothetical protein